MPTSIRELIDVVRDGQELTREQMQSVTDVLMSGEANRDDIAAFLTALHHRGETVEELVGAALSMRRHMHPIRTTRTGIVDTCGTGGSGFSTFNISTASALIAAAAGATVAKHGNRRSTSRSGSSDVLVELGVNIQAELPVVERCLDELGICFCFAPLHHPSVKHVMEVRRSLPHPTVFNLLGPLCNPAAAEFQLLGSGRMETLEILARALAGLGITRAAVVHSRDGIGEISAGAVTDGFLVESGSMKPIEFSPEAFGVEPATVESVFVDDPADSARLIRGVLDGQAGPARSFAMVNAAAVLWVCGIAPDFAEGYSLAAEAVDSGRAADLLRRLAELTHRP